ncbi:hypothetical protein Q6348_02070 [Isoptericola sp. b441]|uniref:Uncharacterized protein n=1 Tax=Actinotalea lenta TaxID=3064654 RepID=A0ABT9D5C4_9CELL|nr:hypothetical protein [Isoptericola sp. b441]MDO8105977.1 hypothetical protein [Isoptericola sp. b441]
MRTHRPTATVVRHALALAVTLLAVLAAAPSASAAQPAPTDDPRPASPAGVVLVGTGGLLWTDIDRTSTPTLWRMVSTGSVGSVSVRTGGTQSCPVDAWLTFSAARRTLAPTPEDAGQDPALDCVPLPQVPASQGVGPTAVPGWSGLVAEQPSAADGGDPEAWQVGRAGALGERIAAVGSCSTAVGPGAAVALARADGTVERYAETLSAVTEADLVACPVDVVDLGQLGFEPEGRRQALARLDRALTLLTHRLPDGWHVVIAGLSGGVGEQGLPAVVDWTVGGGGPVTWLTSASTRRPGLVTLTDLPATAAAAAGADDTDFDGAPLTDGPVRRMSTERTVENRRYLTELTTTVTHLFPVFGGVVVLAGLAAGLALLTGGGRGSAGRRVVRAVLLVASSSPAGAFLAALFRWWVAPAPTVAATLWTVVATFGCALAAWLLARALRPAAVRRPGLEPWLLGGAVATVTWLVLTVDGVTGTTLQQGSVLGSSATVGARFYGFGNLTFAVYAASALVLAGALAAAARSRVAAVAAVGAVGAVTVVVDGWPGYGADIGGILALVPAFAVLLLGLTGRRVTGRRVLAALGLAVLVVAAIGIWDWAGPGPASHLGLFVQRVADGHAWALVAEKASGAWATVANPWGALATLACTATVLVLVGPPRWRPEGLRRAYDRWPVLWRTVVAVVVAAVLGALLNDSGVAVAAVLLGLGGGLLALSWAAQLAASRPAGADPEDALVRATPLALLGVAGGMAAAMLLGSAVLPSQVSAGDVTHGPGTPVVRASTRLVVVGTQGLRWQDVDRTVTPTIWAMVRDGAVVGGVAPGVTTTDRRCLAAGWLALSAGRSVITGSWSDGSFDCEPWTVAPTARGAQVQGWPDLVAAQRSSAYDPHPGVLGDTLDRSGVCSTAVGPGAALALARKNGTVDRYLSLDQALAEPGAAFDCPVTLVDAGAAPYVPASLQDVPTDPAAPLPTTSGQSRTAALMALDATVRRVLAAAPSNATVLLVDVGNPGAGRPWLGVGAVEAGSGLGARFLSSPSTRWEGVGRLLDVPTTVLASQGIANPADFTGATLTAAGARPADVTAVVDGLADLSTRDQALRGLSGWLTGTPMLIALLLLGLAWASGRWLTRGAARVLRRGLDAVLVLLASLPVAMYVMTTWAWWRAADAGAAMWLALAGATVTVAGVAALAPRRPVWAAPGLLASLTFVVLTLDALLGTPLHRGSPLGPSPTLGGRYYGFGNPTYSIYVVGALIGAAALGWWLRERGHRVAAMLAAGVVGLVAMLVDLLPGLGADVGGGLVLLPAAGMVVLAVGGIRVTWTRAGLIGAVGVLLVAGIGVLDWLRPPDQRTHLGRFVQSVLDGTAWETISRKAGYAAATVTSGPIAWITIAVLVGAVLVIWTGRRPAWLARLETRWPVTRGLLIGLLIAGVAGSLVNDYGTRIATVLLAAAVPLVGLLALRSTPDRGHRPRSPRADN